MDGWMGGWMDGYQCNKVYAKDRSYNSCVEEYYYDVCTLFKPVLMHVNQHTQTYANVCTHAHICMRGSPVFIMHSCTPVIL